MRAAAAAEVVQEAGRPEHSMAIFWSSCGECTLIGLARIVALAGDISATEMISSGLHAWCTGTAARRRACHPHLYATRKLRTCMHGVTDTRAV